MMKNFMMGIFVTLLVGGWVIITVKGIISIKTAILFPVGIIIGLILALWLIGIWWDE